MSLRQTAEAWGRNAQGDDHVLDALLRDDLNLTPQTLADGLRTQQPRLYSISSSPKRAPLRSSLDRRRVLSR